jgi:type I restriction enzyme R subunit
LADSKEKQMKFTEEKLEKAFVELLGNENYPHFHGDSITRTAEAVLIDDDLLTYLLTRYESKHLTLNEAKSILLQLKTLPASDLYESNKTIMRWMADGFILKREDRKEKDIHIELIDYHGLEAQIAGDELDTLWGDPARTYRPDYNIYKFVNQLEILGAEKRIPDGII